MNLKSISYGLLLACLLAVACPAASDPADSRWPMFRGPNGSGHAVGTAPLPVEFGPGRNEAWHVALPRGHSSPCVWEERIFLTGTEKGSKKLEIICVQRSDGHVLWRNSVEAETLEHVHKMSSPANATSVADGQRVISYFGSFGLVCHDFAGKELWRLPMPAFRSMNGSGTSPLLVNGTVYLNREDEVDQVLIAVEAASGAVKWQRKHPNATPNLMGVASTPIFWNQQILVHRGGSLSAHDARDGNVLWFIPANTTGCSTPVVGEGKLVLSAWNNAGEADQIPPWPEFSALLEKYDANKDGKLSEAEFPGNLPAAIRPGLDLSLGGNIPLKMLFGFFDENHDQALDADEWKAALIKSTEYLKSQKHGVMAIDLTRPGQPSDKSILWKVERNVPEVPSPLIHAGRVYLVRNGGTLLCVDLRSGDLLYQERLGPSGPYYASPLEPAGNIYIAAGNGQVAVIREGPKFQLLAANDLKDGIFASPAAVGNQLLIRTENNLFAFQR